MAEQFSRTYRGDLETGKAFDELCNRHKFKFPGLVELLIEATLEYESSNEGKFRTPFYLVNEVEYEQFLAWKKEVKVASHQRETA